MGELASYLRLIETGAQVMAAIRFIEGQGGNVVGVATIQIEENERTRPLRARYDCRAAYNGPALQVVWQKLVSKGETRARVWSKWVGDVRRCAHGPNGRPAAAGRGAV